ncbi:hypothetical protein AVEN_32367-1 [Araneus ventricosus]|uniref:Uncharacterized protein n=1 Tax=Araneus ventricosus TaxID=182803 RepID=A0A4Y2NYP1_ARAVE
MTPEMAPSSPNFRSTCWWGGSLPAGPLLALYPSWVGRASVVYLEQKDEQKVGKEKKKKIQKSLHRQDICYRASALTDRILLSIIINRNSSPFKGKSLALESEVAKLAHRHSAPYQRIKSSRSEVQEFASKLGRRKVFRTADKTGAKGAIAPTCEFPRPSF